MPSSETKSRPTTAVILAAGMGTRLKDLHPDLPKGLLRIGDKTLIERSLDLLLLRGFEKIILVTGFAAEAYERMIAPRYPAVRIVHNPGFAGNGSMHSLYLARHQIDDTVLVLESDLLYEPCALTCSWPETAVTAFLFPVRPGMAMRYMPTLRKLAC